MDSIVGITICCCLPIIMAIGLFSIMVSAANRSNPTGSTAILFNRINSWFTVITSRTVVSWITAIVLLSLSVSAEELSLLSSFAFFILIITVIPVTIAYISKFYFTISRRLPGNRLITSSLSNRVVKEGETAELQVQLKVRIPYGYILKTETYLPEKLGSNMREVVGKTVSGVATLSFIVPRTVRGDYILGPINLEYQDIFGFSRITLHDSSKITLTVLPEIPYIEKYNINLSTDEGYDDKNIEARINTDEYYSSRPYVRGDNQRFIHWKLTAKRDEIMVRQPESTTVSYRDLSILILNVLPKIRVNKNTIYSRYRVAAEHALDRQIRIAAAIIDFAHRNGIPVKIAYFDKPSSIKIYEPASGDTVSWLKKLTLITLQNPIINFTKVIEFINSENSVVVTTSETDSTQIAPIINQIIKNDGRCDIMYCPLSNEMRGKLSKDVPKSMIKRFFTKVLLTNDYYSQTTITEKFRNSLKRVTEKYQAPELSSNIEQENLMIQYLHSTGINLKLFKEDQYSSGIDNIIEVLESE